MRKNDLCTKPNTLSETDTKTETLDSETETEALMGLETVSRPRSRDRGRIPAFSIQYIIRNGHDVLDDVSTGLQANHGGTDALFVCIHVYAPPLICGDIKRLCYLTSVYYVGPKSRTERCRKTKIGLEVAHVT